MKRFNQLVLMPLLALLFSTAINAQSPCDQCTDPWGPVQDETITGQTMNNKPSTCTYTFVYKYRTRMCNGQLEVDIVDIYAMSENPSGMFCPLTQFSDCYESRRAAIRSLINHLGMPVTLSQEKACYMIFEVDPPQDFINCIGAQNEATGPWYAFLTCDATSCCKTTYTPNGNGTVDYTLDMSVPCNGTTPPVPVSVTWECRGVQFIVPVLPGQMPSCDDVCYSGSGTIYKQGEEASITRIDASYLTLAPNPANAEVNLSFELPGLNEADVKVFNSQGQIIYSESFAGLNGEKRTTINTLDWAAGLYFVHLDANGNNVKTEMLTISK